MSTPEPIERSAGIRLIKQTLLKIQIPERRKLIHDIIVTHSDMGSPLEWSAPVPHAIIGRTIELYEKEFKAEIIATDEQLDRMADFIADQLFCQAQNKE